MPRIIKTLFDRKRDEPTPEETEAFNRATFVLRCRVERLVGDDPTKVFGKAA